jgi:hypothetical protein
MSTFKYTVGLGNVGSYQVSGTPFATGSIDASTATKIEFPHVTRWIYIKNNGATDVKLGFSENGVEGNNFITIHHSHVNQLDGHSPVLELKVTEIWLLGSSNVDVLAGLTSIDNNRITNISPSGSNWSGSAGVG